MIGEYVVVRTRSAGVHVGVLIARNGKEVTLAKARRLWRWFGANTLNEVSLRGVAPESKVSEPIPEILLLEAIEIIPTTTEAEACLKAAVWTK